MTDTTNTPAPVADLDNRAAFDADMHAINPGVCRAVLDIYWESTEGKLWRAALARGAACAPASVDAPQASDWPLRSVAAQDLVADTMNHAQLQALGVQQKGGAA